MITCHEGRIGGGKTFGVLKGWILPALLAGREVCTNVDLKPEAIKAYLYRVHGFVMADEQIRMLSGPQMKMAHKSCAPGALLVIDEAHCWFNARGWQSNHKEAEEFMWFLSQSRKVSIDVVFISQSVKNMDAQFARLCESIYRYRNLKGWTLPGLSFIKFPARVFIAAQYDYSGLYLGTKFYGFEQEIGDLYDTKQLLRSFDLADRRGTGHGHRDLKMLRRRKFRAACFAFGICLGAFLTVIRPGSPVVATATPASSTGAVAAASAPVGPVVSLLYATNDLAWVDNWEQGVGRIVVFRKFGRFVNGRGCRVVDDAANGYVETSTPDGRLVTIRIDHPGDRS